MNYEDTWWGGIINDLGMNLGVNESWAGSRVSNTNTSNSGDLGPDRCMASKRRIDNLGNNGTPDFIFFFGGTNDIGANVTKGTFNAEVTYNDDTITYNNFAEAYTIALKRIKEKYPEAEIIVLLPTYTSSYYTDDKLKEYNEIIKEICDYFNIKYVDLRNCITTQYLKDGIHPNKEGMKLVKEYIKSSLLGNGEKGDDKEDNTSKNSHLQPLPSNLTSTTNLFKELKPAYEYYDGTNWSSNIGVYSITIQVSEEDKIYATSFERAGTNGGGRNGIRVTYFSDDKAISSLGPDEVYKEFSSSGYLTVPSGVNAVCIPFWNNNESNCCYLIKKISSTIN